MTPDRAADFAATTSAVLATATWLNNAEQDLRILASIVAIIAGLCAAWYHYKKAKAL